MIVEERESLASLGAGLAEELAGQGYTPDCVARHLRLLHRLDEWMAGEGLAPGELTAAEVERFVQARRAAGQGRWPSQRGVGPLLAYLRRAGVVPMPPAPVAATSVERVVASYRRWLVEERSLAASTVEDHERYVSVFFSKLAEPVRDDLSRLSAAVVTAAVRSQCRSRSIGWAKNFNTVLRSLLRFLFLDGAGHRPPVALLRLAPNRHVAPSGHSPGALRACQNVKRNNDHVMAEGSDPR